MLAIQWFVRYAEFSNRATDGRRSLAGLEADLWTCPRVQALIERQYKVRYHVDHLPRLLRRLGFTA
jgi:transposase